MDKNKIDLTFLLLDDLALAAARRRVNPVEYLRGARVGRVGPLLELLALSRHNLLPLDALPPSSFRESLLGVLRKGQHGGSECAELSETRFGFTVTSRDPHEEDQISWIAFCRKAQEAAELSLPKQFAQGLVGAMQEIEENVHIHSERAHDGVVGFRGTKDEFEFAVMDSGIGVLASLRQSPDFKHVTDAGNAIRTTLTDGKSRLSYVEPGHGYGFQHLFVELANLSGELRFRSGDHALTVDGTSPSLVTARLSQKVQMPGFVASVVCRFKPIQTLQ